jgi:hypothetical protein
MTTAGLVEAADRTPGTLVLHVMNLAAVSDSNLAKAEAIAGGIVKGIRVRTIWAHSPACAEDRDLLALHLTVVLVSPESAAKRPSDGTGDGVLGRAYKDSGRAYIFIDPIRDVSAHTRGDEGLLFGRAIAHEIGHLLLPEIGHTKTGIMAAAIDTSPFRVSPTFTPTQQRAIHTTLESRTTDLQTSVR